MREIIFRGKSMLGLNPFITGFYLYDELRNRYSITWKPDDDNWQITPVFEESIGQFTGLNDKNGTRVFEGDILKSPSDDIVFEIKWRNPMFIFSDKNGITRGINYPLTAFEVIGNIHENPELLK